MCATSTYCSANAGSVAMNCSNVMPVAASASASSRARSLDRGALLFSRREKPASNSSRLLAGKVQDTCDRLIGA